MRTLRAVRNRHGWTQKEAAAAASIATVTLTSYETGARRPPLTSLQLLLERWRATPAERDAAFAEAGYEGAPARAFDVFASRRPRADRYLEEIDAYPWLCLISNERFEIVGWNNVSMRVAEMDFGTATSSPEERHFLRLAALQHFRDRLTSWDDLLGYMISFWKADLGDPERAAELSLYMTALIAQLQSDHPDVLARAMGLWAAAEPMPVGQRNVRPVTWTVADGTVLEFHTLFRPLSEYDSLNAYDWHPANAATWRWMEGQRSGPDPLQAHSGAISLPAEGSVPWNELFRTARERLGLSRRAVADSAVRRGLELSEETVYSVEAGRRVPRQGVVVALATALDMDVATRNAIIEQLHLPPEPSPYVRWLTGTPIANPRALGIPGRPIGRVRLSQLQRQLRGFRWPCVVIDHECRVVGINGAAAAVLGAGRAGGMFPQRPHLLDIVTNARFRAQARNWHEVVGILFPGVMKPFLNPVTTPEAGDTFREAVRRAHDMNPDAFREINEIWSTGVEPPARARVLFQLQWSAEDGADLLFHGFVSGWDGESPFWVVDLHPGDATTWEWLDARVDGPATGGPTDLANGMTANAIVTAKPPAGRVTMTEWQDLVVEDVLEPELAICDPHHHLWDRLATAGAPPNRYLLDELLADTGSGHNVVSTVFVECLSMYRADGPAELRPIGETEFVQGVAAMSASGTYGATRATAGIVSFADLSRGEAARQVLEAHIAASPNRFRGIRHATAWHASPEIRNSHVGSPDGLLGDATFRRGFAQLAPLGLSFDAWLYHTQIPELTSLARAFPETAIVLDHFGGPLGIGPYAGKGDDVFAEWRKNIDELATCPNVHVKIGGLAMPVNGFDWHKHERPPTSEELAAATARYYLHTIDRFGPNRCMFESNFPVDRVSCSYQVLWNSFKRIASGFSAAEKAELFHGTATRFYRLGNA